MMATERGTVQSRCTNSRYANPSNTRNGSACRALAIAFKSGSTVRRPSLPQLPPRPRLARLHSVASAARRMQIFEQNRPTRFTPLDLRATNSFKMNRCRAALNLIPINSPKSNLTTEFNPTAQQIRETEPWHSARDRSVLSA